MANVIRLKRASGSDPTASDLVSGEPAVRTDTGELFFKKDDGSVAKVSGAGGGPDFKYLALRNAANNGAASFPNADFTLVTSGTTSAITPTAANTLLVSVNGVIQKPNTGTSTPSSGFALSGSTIKFGGNISAAPDFILYQESGGIGEPSDETVSEEKLKVSNSPVNGYFLSAQSGNTGGLTWAAPVATSCTGNSATATALETARTINGTSFDGTANITVTAAAGTLTGNTLNSSVTASSLTSLGDLSGLTVTGNMTVDTSTLFVNASTNRVGIGTTSPDTKLHIESANNILALFESTDADALIEFKDNGTSDTILMGALGGDDLLLRCDAGNIIFKLGNNSEKARFDSSGRLLIGTTTEGESTLDDLTIATSGDTGITIRSGTSNNGAIGFSDGTSGADEYRGLIDYDHNGNYFRFYTNASERMRIASDGKVGIGLTSPARLLHQHLASSSSNYHQFTNSTTGSSSTDGFLIGLTSLEEGLIWNYENTPIRIGTNNTERLRIDSSGRLLKGTTSAITLANNPNTQIVGTSTSDASLALIRQTNGGGEFVLAAGASGSNISNGNGLGFIKFMGYHTNGYDEYARIQSYADGTTGDGDAPGRLVFATTADGAASPTERMRIDSSGVVRVGGTASYNSSDKMTLVGTGNTSLTIDATSSTSSSIFFADGADGTEAYRGYLQYSHASDALFIGTSASERMRIDSSGRVGIGTTSPDRKLHVASDFIRVDDGYGLDTSGATEKVTLDNGFISLTTNSEERIRIDSGGRLLHGVTSSIDVCSVAPSRLQVHNNASVLTASFTGYGAHAGGSVIALGKSRSSTVGDATGAVTTNDTLGDIRFGGSDGTDMETTACAIRGEVDGSVSSNTIPGRLVFSTNSGSGSAERMRINNNGKVLIATTTTSEAGLNNDELIIGSSSDDANHGLTIVTPSSRYGTVAFSDGSSGTGRGLLEYNHSGDFFRIYVAGSERMRIDSSGNVGINESSNINGRFHVQHDALAENILFATRFNDQSNDKPIFAVTEAQMSGFADSGTIIGNHNRDIFIGPVFQDTGVVDTSDTTGICVRSSGNVGINQDNPSRARLHVVGDNNDGDIIAKFKSGSGNANSTAFIALVTGYPDTANDYEGHAYIGVQRNGSGNQTKILFKTYSGDSGGALRTRMTIEPNNNIDIQGKIHTQLGTQINSFNKETTGDQIRFNTTGTTRGSISSNGSTVAFNTSASDRSMKKNFENWTEDTLNLFKNINPQKFNFLDQEDGTNKEKGFIAQDMVASFPEAYIKNDDDKYMFNASGMVVYLMKALQEAIGRIEALEAK